MSANRRQFYRVELPYCVCGFFTDDRGILVECAPILGWAKGKHVSILKRWAQKKNGTVELLAVDAVDVE